VTRPNYDEHPRGIAGVVTVEVPAVPFPGSTTDAAFYRSAAQHVRRGYTVGGSNLSATVATLLERVADGLEKDQAPAGIAGVDCPGCRDELYRLAGVPSAVERAVRPHLMSCEQAGLT